MRKLGNGWVGLAVLAAVLTVPTAASAAPANPCDNNLGLGKAATAPAYVFLGVRGSGEPSIDADGRMGTRVLKAYRGFADDPHYQGKIACTGSLHRYKAMPVPTFGAGFDQWNEYLREVTTNYQILQTQLRRLTGKYPDTKFIVSGYSQGAAVAHMAVSELVRTTPALKTRFEGLALIADPLADDTDYRQPTTSDGWNGPARSGTLTIANRMADGTVGGAAWYTALTALGKIHRVLPDQLCDAVTTCEKLQQQSRLTEKYQDTLTGMRTVVTASPIGRTSTGRQLTALGIPTASICYVGDVVCSPIGTWKSGVVLRQKFRYWPDWTTWGRTDVHKDYYTRYSGWEAPAAAFVAAH
ncbi:cutinase family protein [Actinoplanes awajinensis]|uniref:Fungal lipase-type domain-containing protein n=1 Tax=Actinoplanes awajinensis subsp. mycoplanecinus TaxID=135947 RepID=A0A101JCR6_9ACTN|nr:cutinase family protein [Actinoplanes awajinensis]KUL24389.1 hypothetical protein ADL15_43600 [Actinoplanes awajinensis subsp. mycoplanecinus]